MSTIKNRRRHLSLSSHKGLFVGDCVPFYFCPRSIMLYLIYRGNSPDLDYRGGQGPIIHLEADLQMTIQWANQVGKRWAFTLSNAGAYYFEDMNDLACLYKINWAAIHTNHWGGMDIDPSVKEGKQAEFLIEQSFPWQLVTRIGVHNQNTYQQVLHALSSNPHHPIVEIRPTWYY